MDDGRLAPPALDEAGRLAALRALGQLDTPPEDAFDAVVRAAAYAFDARIALVSLVDAERQWFKAKTGLQARETPRDISFCGHAIQDVEPMVVLNAPADPRFRDNPLVIGEPYVRFYAGAPLVMPNGAAVGTLCIIDDEPRYRFTEEEEETLRFFGQVTRDRLLAAAAAGVTRPPAPASCP